MQEIPTQPTISSLSLALLIGSNNYQEINSIATRLYCAGIISTNPNHKNAGECNLTRVDSIIIVAQSYPLLASKVIDYWDRIQDKTNQLISYTDLDQRLTAIESAGDIYSNSDLLFKQDKFDRQDVGLSIQVANANHLSTCEAIEVRLNYFNGLQPDGMESKSASGIKGVASSASQYWRVILAPDGWSRGTDRIDYGYFDSLTKAVNFLIKQEIKHGLRTQ